MTVPTSATVPRKAGVFTGDGSTKTFPFVFKIPAKANNADAQVEVYISESSEDNAVDVLQVLNSDYTVSVYSDQESNPGGTVTFQTAPGVGIRVSILSAVPDNQDVILTNHDKFSPIILNQEFDKLTILIQQLMEELGRALIVPATSTKTREQVLQEVLDVAASAKEFAAKAVELYEQVLLTKAEVEALAATQEAALEAKADELKDEIKAFTDEQEGRVERAADWALSEIGVSCQRAVWTVDKAIASGTVIELPENMHYLVGHKMMTVYWNNMCLNYGREWLEVGVTMNLSETFQILMDLEVGDVIQVYMVPLGAKDYLNDLQALYNDLQATKDQLAFADIEDSTEIPMTYSTDITGTASSDESVPMTDAETE